MLNRKHRMLLTSIVALSCAGIAGLGAHDRGQAATVEPEAPLKSARAGDRSSNFGDPVASAAPIPLARALAQPDRPSGRQVISGRIGKVCQRKGCWMTLHDGDAMVRVETGHRFAIPADASGQALVLGSLARTSLSEDRAAHLRSESLDVSAGEAWSIEALGVRILE